MSICLTRVFIAKCESVCTLGKIGTGNVDQI